MPDLTAEQRKNIRTALRVAKRKGASPKEQKALVEAMGVESAYRDLNYGDRDSLGILQQRNNGAWGAAKESVATDVGQFLAVARAKNATGKYGSAGDLAQAVQVSGFPDRYDQRSGEAEAILAQYGGGRTPARRVKAPGAATTTETTTTPGTDNSALRRQLVGQFLAQGGIKNSSAVLGLAAQYGQAADVPGVTTTQRVKAPAQASPSTRTSASGKPKKLNIKELFWNGQQATNWDEGSFRPRGYVAGHSDHVHVSGGPNTSVYLGKLAQSMGLRVSDNPYFDPVERVHAEGSYHYKTGRTKSGKTAGEAIDVSGDPEKMALFARRVAKLIRQGGGRA